MSLMMPMRPNVDQGRVVIDFDSIKIRLASPEKIRSWSHGEVTKPRSRTGSASAASTSA